MNEIADTSDASTTRRRRVRIGIAVGVFMALGAGAIYWALSDSAPGTLIYVYASPPDGEPRTAESTSVFDANDPWELRFATTTSHGTCNTIYRVMRQRPNGSPTRLAEIGGEPQGSRTFRETGQFVVSVEYGCAEGAAASTSIQVMQK